MKYVEGEALVVTQLGTQRPLDDGLLEPAGRGLDFGCRQRPFPHELVEDVNGNGRE